MPFLDGTRPDETTQVTGFDPQAYVPPDFASPASDLNDVAGAFIRGETTFGALATEAGERWDLYFDQQSGLNTAAPGYDPFEDGDNVALIESDPDLARSFAHVRTPQEAWRVRQRVAQERRDDMTMSEAGPGGVALMFGLGAVDPVNLLPFSTAARAYQTGRVVKGALEGASAGLLSAAASETVLQATQEERADEESLINIAASTILSGALGGGIGLLHGRDVGAMAETFKDEIVSARRAFREPEGGGGAGGAQVVDATTMSQETTKSAFGFEKLGANRSPVGNPLQRLLNSPAVAVRRMVQKLAENPLMMKGAAEDVTAPIAAETRIKMWDAPLVDALKAIEDAFIEHRGFKPGTFAARTRAGIEDVTGRRSPQMLTWEQFKARVSMAARRNDKDPTFPEIVRASAAARQKLLDPLKDAAIEVKHLPEDVEPKTALSYLTRVWRTEKIAARRPEFEDRAVRWLMTRRDEARSRDTTHTEKFRTLAKEAAGNVDRVDKLLADVDAQVVKEPTRLASFLAKRGGLRESGGELKAMDAHKARPGLVSSKGLTLDEAARIAQEAGYLETKHGPDGPERATINDLLDALRDDLGGINRYSEIDADALRAFKEMDRAKIREARGSLGRERTASKATRDHFTDKAEAETGFALLDDGDLKLIAAQITDKILGNNGTGLTTFNIEPNKRGSLKERTFLIPDKDIEDFLDNDIERVLRIYKRQMGADVEIARAFGSSDMKDQMAEIADAYEAARRAIEKSNEPMTDAQKEKKMLQLQRALESDQRDVAAIRDRLRGRYNIPEDPMGMLVRTGRAVKSLNYLRLMGGVAPGSIPDVGSIVLYHGMGRLMRTGIMPLLKNLKRYRMTTRETRLAGTALDRVLDTRAMSWADIGEDYARYSGFERGLKYATDKFGLVNLASQWNHIVKGLAGSMSQTRTLEAVEALVQGKATKKETERLNFLGINRNMAERINDQYRAANGLDEVKKPSVSTAEPEAADTVAHWMSEAGGDGKKALALADAFNKADTIWKTSPARQSLVDLSNDPANSQLGGLIKKAKAERTDKTFARQFVDEPPAEAPEPGGLRWANTEAWTDREAVDAFRAAIVKETDATVITPGQEKPLWMSTEWGSVVGQFRSFTMSAMSRVTAAGLQRRDAATLQGLIMMTSLGMLSYYLKVRDEDIAWDNPAVWVKEGVDRSGALGWIFEANNIIEKTTGYGVGDLTGTGGSSRFAGRGTLSAILGPSVGIPEDLAAFFTRLGHGELSGSDVHRIRKMLPLQNVFWLRYLIDQAENPASRAIGAEPRVEARSD
jgi:hypothetical protein